MLSLKLAAQIIWVPLTLIVFQNSFAQNPDLPGVTLEDFFNAAVNYSPDLRIAEENLNISSARKKAARLSNILKDTAISGFGAFCP